MPVSRIRSTADQTPAAPKQFVKQLIVLVMVVPVDTNCFYDNSG